MSNVFQVAVSEMSMVSVVIITVIFLLLSIFLIVKKLLKKKAIFLIWLFVAAIVFTIVASKIGQVRKNSNLANYQIILENGESRVETLYEIEEFGYKSYYNSNGILQFQENPFGITIHGGDGYVKSLSQGTITKLD